MLRLDPMATPNGRGQTEDVPAAAGTEANRVLGHPL